MDIFKCLFDSYKEKHFLDSNGKFILEANTSYLTAELSKIGLEFEDCNKVQHLDGAIVVYPNNMFGAFDAGTSRFVINKNTVVVHHCIASWGSTGFKMQLRLKKLIANKFYGLYKILYKIKKLIQKIYDLHIHSNLRSERRSVYDI